MRTQKGSGSRYNTDGQLQRSKGVPGNSDKRQGNKKLTQKKEKGREIPLY